MGHFRVLGSQTFTCPNNHEFRSQMSYDYSTKQTMFEVTYKSGEWVAPADRTPRTFLPVCPEPDCGEACSFEGVTVGGHGRTHNVQVGEKEATAVAIHPTTGEVVYCFGRPDAPMPDTYKREGFQKVQFHHYHDLQRFCRQQGVVNDIEGDWHQDGEGFFEDDLKERRKKEKMQYEQYMEEREKVRKAYPELAEKGRGR